jgi:hypothetical protein
VEAPVAEAPTKRIAVIGSRDFSDYSYLESRLLLHFNENDVLVSGGARGADRLAESFADKHDFAKEIYPADWQRFGRSAGFRRNVDIINACDYVVAFWDGVSKGTSHSIELAKKAGKQVKIYYFGREHALSKFIH